MHVNYICHINTTCTFYIAFQFSKYLSAFRCQVDTVKQMVVRHQIATLGWYVHDSTAYYGSRWRPHLQTKCRLAVDNMPYVLTAMGQIQATTAAGCSAVIRARTFMTVRACMGFCAQVKRV